jgi:16S rRNA (uracil1498-N3)-methyltransferase
MKNKPSRAGGRVLVKRLPSKGMPAQLSPDEARHLVTVLRRQDGDELEALDGKGGAVECVLRVRGQDCFLEWSAQGVFDGSGATAFKTRIILAQAILKGEAMEWVVEKSVELGADALFPLVCDHCVVKLDKKGPATFQERWGRIADQALKQCGRRRALEVHEPGALIPALKALKSKLNPQILFFDEVERGGAAALLDHLLRVGESSPAIVLLIGPEGGWSERERRQLKELGVEVVSLGADRILRAETAALHALSIATAVRSRMA